MTSPTYEAALAAKAEELNTTAVGKFLAQVYRRIRAERSDVIGRIICRLVALSEGGQYESGSLRRIMSDRHDVHVGAYSYGECFRPGAFPPQVTVGRYSTIAPGVRVFNQNHPIDQLSTHPFFYLPELGYTDDVLPPRHTLEIGHDVWLGQNAIVTPGCRRIGNGAIVGAGAVVTKNVPPFAIVVGVPAAVVRFRFSSVTIKAIEESAWWDHPAQQLSSRSLKSLAPTRRTIVPGRSMRTADAAPNR